MCFKSSCTAALAFSLRSRRKRLNCGPIISVFCAVLAIHAAFSRPVMTAPSELAVHAAPAEPAERVASEITESIDAGKLKDLGLTGLPGYPCLPELVPVLTKAGSDGPWAASFLARHKCTSLVKAVVPLVGHENTAVRARVAELLGHLGGGEAENGVGRLLDDRDSDVRSAAIRASCEIAPTSCGPNALKRALRDPSPEVRAACVDAMAASEYAIPRKSVRQLLSDSSPKVVVTTLGKLSCDLLDGDDVGGVIDRRVNDSLVSAAAIAAAGRCPTTDVCDSLLEHLLSLPRDEADAPEATNLVTAIGSCCGRSGRPALEEFAASRASATDMARIAVSNTQSAREVAVAILGEVGSTSSLPALKSALSDSYYRVRLSALKAISRLGLTCSLAAEISLMVQQDHVASVRQEAIAQLAQTPCASQ